MAFSLVDRWLLLRRIYGFYFSGSIASASVTLWLSQGELMMPTKD